MKKALGKGLSALIPDSYLQPSKPEPITSSTEKKNAFSIPESAFQLIPIGDIRPNHDQPRQEFAPEAIEELAASIREKGVLQPVIVKKTGTEEGRNLYELVCGERRLRASLLCGLKEIPAIIKDIAQDDFLEWALIENIQRQDLNAVEEAQAYQKLMENRLFSQEEIAKRVGKNRVTVTNALRLLRLPEEVIEKIQTGQLTGGHARAILGLPSPEHQRQMARRIAEENLSVRQVEAIVTRSNAHRRKPKNARNLKPEIVDLEHRLVEHFGTQVKIYPRKNMKQGRLEIHYFSLDDLDRILEKIKLPKA
ncbi:MAG: ParB/RepB/Spo0J family partition protein [Candidatus Omnitrophica bacterium]|nr:ParB/RepB/Spo0J family partition protein [Candidatus Omnitrophota bacterium]